VPKQEFGHADNKLGEVLCPVCCSGFHVKDSRLTTTTAPMRQLGKFQLLERVGVGGFGAVWTPHGLGRTRWRNGFAIAPRIRPAVGGGLVSQLSG
jgi:hypothetical protein